MFKIGELLISPDVVEMIPESVARENGVVPLRYIDGRLHILLPEQPDMADILWKLNFILNKELVHEISEMGHVMEVANQLYSMYRARVTRCNLKFKLNCSRRWLELVDIDSPGERFCPDCKETVHQCATEEEAERHARMGHCVSLHIPNEYENCDTMGLIEYPS